MNKIQRIAASATLVGGILLPAIVAAATIPNVQFQNGQTTVDCNGGAMVNATFHNVQVAPNEVIEYVRTQVGTEPFVDTSVGGTLGLQEGNHNVTASVKCPPNTGTYQLDMQTAGIYGGGRAINGGDNVNGSNSFGGAIRVVANAPSNQPPVGSPTDDFWTKLMAWFESKFPSTPAPSTACTTFNQYASLSYGQTGSQVKAYQQFLISQGEYTKATGFFGPLTLAAEASFASSHDCN